MEVPTWCSGLRVQHCCSCGTGCNCSASLIPGPGTFTCCWCGQKKKREKKKSTLGVCLNKLEMWYSHVCADRAKSFSFLEVESGSSGQDCLRALRSLLDPGHPAQIPQRVEFNYLANELLQNVASPSPSHPLVEDINTLIKYIFCLLYFKMILCVL